jgi:hypothetical protein
MAAADDRKCRWGILSTAEIATKNVLAMKASPNAVVVVRCALLNALCRCRDDATSSSVVLQAVASRGLEKAAAWAAKHGVPKAYGTYDELIADPDIGGSLDAIPLRESNAHLASVCDCVSSHQTPCTFQCPRACTVSGRSRRRRRRSTW